MTSGEILSRVRTYLNDPESKMWGDAELGHYLDEAVREYSGDSMLFRGNFDYLPVGGGEFRYPDDFICFLQGYRDDGHGIVPSCSHDLGRVCSDYYTFVGRPEAVYDDLSDDGFFRMFPDPTELMFVPDTAGVPESGMYGVRWEVGDESYGIEVWEPSGRDYPAESYGELYGLDFDTEYGVVWYDGEQTTEQSDDWYGEAVDDYGVTIYAEEYIYMGDIQYVREAEVEEVVDYMALIYNVVSRAYSADSDFANADASKLYRRYYDRRVDMLRPIQRETAGTMRSGNFF